MKMHSFRSLTLGAVLLIAAGTASAGVINFSNGMTGLNNTNLGQYYTFGSTGLTAYALVPTGGWSQSTCSDTTSEPCLYYKYTQNDPVETGLGLVPDPSKDNEIFYPNGVGLTTASGYIWGLELGSVQTGESWQVLGCSNDSGCTTVLGQGIGGSSDSTVTLTGFANAGYWGYVVDVPCANGDPTCSLGSTTASTDLPNNIVLMSVTTVPEPGTLALFAAGLLGCGLFLRRRARQH